MNRNRSSKPISHQSVVSQGFRRSGPGPILVCFAPPHARALLGTHAQTDASDHTQTYSVRVRAPRPFSLGIIRGARRGSLHRVPGSAGLDGAYYVGISGRVRSLSSTPSGAHSISATTSCAPGLSSNSGAHVVLFLMTHNVRFGQAFCQPKDVSIIGVFALKSDHSLQGFAAMVGVRAGRQGAVAHRNASAHAAATRRPCRDVALATR